MRRREWLLVSASLQIHMLLMPSKSLSSMSYLRPGEISQAAVPGAIDEQLAAELFSRLVVVLSVVQETIRRPGLGF